MMLSGVILEWVQCVKLNQHFLYMYATTITRLEFQQAVLATVLRASALVVVSIFFPSCEAGLYVVYILSRIQPEVTTKKYGFHKIPVPSTLSTTEAMFVRWRTVVYRTYLRCLPC